MRDRFLNRRQLLLWLLIRSVQHPYVANLLQPAIHLGRERIVSPTFCCCFDLPPEPRPEPTPPPAITLALCRSSAISTADSVRGRIGAAWFKRRMRLNGPETQGCGRCYMARRIFAGRCGIAARRRSSIKETETGGPRAAEPDDAAWPGSE
nr:hypothetical protein CFP56_43913 [Quercus suber]